MKEKIMLLDGSSLFFRAFYALPLLTAPNGEYTNAVYGFSTMLMKIIKEWEPKKILVSFDKSRHTFRTDIYPEYKGNRSKAPEELTAQIPILKEIMNAWGITFLELDGFEADDIIGSFAKEMAKKEGNEIFIVTGDKDALQLIEKNIKVIFTQKGITETFLYDENTFKKEYGFEPIKLIDLKGLMGDKSDNIPGIPGVGIKTAKKLLIEYGGIEDVFENIDKISGKKLKKDLIENEKLAYLSKKLATIDCFIELNFSTYDLSIKPNISKLVEICRKYSLNTVIKNIEKVYKESSNEALKESENQTEISYTEIDSEEKITQFFHLLEKEDEIYFFADFVGITVTLKMVRVSLSVGNNVFLVKNDSYLQEIFTFIKKKRKTCFFYDAKQFFHILPELELDFYDVKLSAYLLDPEGNDYSLEKVAERYVYGYFNANKDIGCCERVLMIKKLKEKLFGLLKVNNLWQLYKEIELPLIPVLVKMEKNGIFINKEILNNQSKNIDIKINELKKDIFCLAGEEFNLNSPKQLGVVLFEKMCLPVIKKTKIGYSTNAEVLEEIKEEHEIVEEILQYRLLTKIKTTYLDALPSLINLKTKRVHTNFNQMVTATGRLSSSEPNLQNIPIRREEGREIRSAFEPGDGYDYILSADYSQIELRVLAHLSEDDNFLSAFLHGEDIHARTAAEVFDVPLNEVTSDLRRKAKSVNFGIVYGISDYGLAKDLGISRKEAATYIETYFKKCNGIKKFLEEMVETAREKGFVGTLFDRKRELPAITSRNFTQRSLAERMAMNTPIQGTAADIIKKAMVAICYEFKKHDLKSKLLLQVHDELVFEVVKEELNDVIEIVKRIMENVVLLKVPLEVDIYYGKNWLEAK